MPKVRTRLALALVSVWVIGLELALMQVLALRFWHHFAHMVISVALLGFGASGSLLVLARSRVAPCARGAFTGLLLAASLSALPVLWAVRAVPLDVHFLAWSLGEAAGVLLVELCLFVPFLLAGTAVGVALMDLPDRLGGHYAANLLGSGVGALAALGLMHLLEPEAIVAVLSAAPLAGGAVVAPWRHRAWPAAVAACAVALVLAAWHSPRQAAMSPYKTLPQTLAMPGAEHLAHTSGPLGRLDVVAAPALHYAPGLSLHYDGPVPPHALILTDGDGASPVYACDARSDWRFLDWTTWAAPFHLRSRAHVLLLGAGGGSAIGLALYHESPAVIALEMNPQVAGLMRGVLLDRGGAVYDAPGVRVVEAEARGYLAATGETYDLVHLPPVGGFGPGAAGLYSAQESYLYTIEAFEAMLARLSPRGLVSVTRWADVPPREGLKVFDTAVEALRRSGREPRRHLAMLRSWSTVTVLLFASPVGEDEASRLRTFAERRAFDLAYLPDLRPEEVNRYHVLERPYFYEGALALLGPHREEYLKQYPFAVAAATDDRPYFHHFFRWRAWPILEEQLGRRARAFLETGYLMLLAALVQTAALAAILILVPLAPRAAALRHAPRRAPTLAFFLLIGIGFMLLEMALLQRLILYLAHPIYSGAAVIAAFLIFAGAGSAATRLWRAPARWVGVGATAATVALAVLTLVFADRWLAPTMAWPTWAKMLLAALTIAPLAFAMGHLMPTGLRLASSSALALVPWAWGVNGFASVGATVAAPLVACALGFSAVMLVAAGCYALAAAALLCLGKSAQEV